MLQYEFLVEIKILCHESLKLHVSMILKSCFQHLCVVDYVVE